MGNLGAELTGAKSNRGDTVAIGSQHRVASCGKDPASTWFPTTRPISPPHLAAEVTPHE